MLFGSTPLTEAQVGSMLSDQRAEIESLLPRLRAPTAAVHDPLGLRTALELGEDLLDLVDRAKDASVPAELRRAAVNTAYDGLVAIITLYKASVDVPKVPRPRGAPPPSPGKG
jgi:hypothetical protein